MYVYPFLPRVSDSSNRSQSNNSFQYPITTNIQTLSTKNVERGNDPYGILYVPDLGSDECKEAEGDYVPSNATRLRNLPQGSNYALIAIAPWFSAPCINEYFQSARTSPVKAMFVYQPGTSAAMPPTMNDASWGLGDGGSWKSANNFPTYAIMSVSGGIIVDQLGLYSGNITDVPHGHELASIFSPTDYVRLWATVSTGEVSSPGSISFTSLTNCRSWKSASQPLGLSGYRPGSAHPCDRHHFNVHASSPAAPSQ